MKTNLVIILCLLVSIYSQNCSEVTPTSKEECYFKSVLNENNTCCYIKTESGKEICYEVDFELFDNETSKNGTIDEVANRLTGTNAVDFSCDSDQRSQVTQESQNYLYVGVLTLLSLIF